MASVAQSSAMRRLAFSAGFVYGESMQKSKMLVGFRNACGPSSGELALPFEGFAPLCLSDFAYGMKTTTGVCNANIASERCDCGSTLHQDFSEQFMDSSKSPKGTSMKANQQVPSLRLAASAFAEMLATSCFPPNANESIKQGFATEDPFLQLKLFLNDLASPQGISGEGPGVDNDIQGEQAGSSGSCTTPLFANMFGGQQVALDA